MRAGLAIPLAVVSSVAVAGAADARPVSGPHQTVEYRFTTKRPNAPSGFSFDASYHAAGDRDTDPPYMRRMAFYSPRGLRYDTSVPERCAASDVELGVFGAAACPRGSRLGGGTSDVSFLGYPNTVALDFLNNTNEQIILARSPGLTTITRGRMRADGSIEYAAPTCYPSIPAAGCPVDNVLQLRSSMRVPPYTRSSSRGVRSWLTTPRTCPKAGHWESPIRWWWADGTVDRVVTRQPCQRPRRRAARASRTTG
jgi:hypothetical protein